MVFRAAGGKRLGGIFGNQIKQVVAVNIVFTQRRRLADMGFNVFDRLRSASGSQAADGELPTIIIPSNIKQLFIFCFIPPSTAIPPLFAVFALAHFSKQTFTCL
jgi:hypothetical protein